MTLLSAFSAPCLWNHSVRRTVNKSGYRTATCALPDDRNLTERQSEIAAKIEKLRQQKRLAYQRKSSPTANNSETSSATDSESNISSSNSNLDDSQFADTIAEAEALFGTSPKNESDYKPKVSTWGVFPRPENISRTYGGGRAIPIGGKVTTAESRAYDARVAERLARYRGSSTEEAALEAKHAEEIDAAIAEANTMMSRGFGYDATSVLRPVLKYASPKSRRGGELRLALALACEDAGKRSEARELYALLLRENQFNEIRRTVKRLSTGFADMEMMRVQEGATDGVLGFRSEDFTIPNITGSLDKPYRTVLGKEIPEMSEEEKRREAQTLLLIGIALIGVPTLILILVRSFL